MNRLLAIWVLLWRPVIFLARRGRPGRWLAKTWNGIRFRVSRITYSQRERVDAARLGSHSAWTLIRLAVVPLLLAVLALFVFGAGPFLYGRLAAQFGLPVLARFPPIDPQSFSGFAGSIAQATAAVLALFFAAISVVASTAYARITVDIRSLVAHDPLNRRYLRLLAHVTAASLGAAALPSAGYVPSSALIWYLFIVAGVCMAAFLPLGVRTFALFDPDSLSVYPARTFSRALKAVARAGHRWLDPSFQNHANRVASSQLDLLDDLLAFVISEARPRNNAVVALIRQILRVAAYYAAHKHAIPSDSLWFTKKAAFRRWDLTDSSATEIALQTGTTPAPEQVADFSFVESRVASMLRRGLQYLLTQNALDDVATVLGDVSGTVAVYARHFGQPEAMDCTAMVRSVLLERLKSAEIAGKPLKYVQLVDLLGYMAIAPVLYAPLAIAERTPEDLANLVQPLVRLNRNGLYTHVQPRRVLQDAEDLFARLDFERTVEGELRTAPWYVRQILALAWASHIRDVIKNLPLIIEREFLSPSRELASSNRSVLAAVWLQRAIEACHKAKDRIHALERTYEHLKSWQIAELRWQPSGGDAALVSIEEHRVNVVRLLAAAVPNLVAEPQDDSLPDVVGPARAWIADELVSMMDLKQEAGFLELFAAYFSATLATHDQLLAMMRETGREYYAYAAINTLLDLMDISGFALLFSELDGTKFGVQTKATWDVFFGRAPDPGATLKALYTAIDARLDGPIFSSSAMRRQEWGRRFGAALERRGVDTEREFDPFSRRRPLARHQSPVIESISVLYGHPMDEAHDYFGALYLTARPDSNGVAPPRAVKNALDSIELAQQRMENAENEPPQATEET